MASSGPRVAIIGGGMSGICLGAMLRRAGIQDFRLFEKAYRYGGTWRDNSYPGLTCDVPSRFYQFSFAPNPDWTHLFPSGSEIWAYFDRVADQFRLRERTRFGSEVVRSEYADGVWQVTTSDGLTEEFDFVVSATGVLHHPRYPDIEGLDTFRGPTFHSARWRHDVDIKDRTVGVIGTGSTGAQIMCALAGEAAQLVSFQRTPQWTLPLGNRPISTPVRLLHRWVPAMNKISYRFWRGVFEAFTPAFTKPGIRRNLVQALARRQLGRVGDSALRGSLSPDYEPGCKRLVVTTTYYDVMQRSDVRVETEKIVRVEPDGVRLASGELVELDVLVLATGFDASAYFRPMELLGEDGQEVSDTWVSGAKAYRSVGVPGYPNFFMLMGPNSPVGNYALTAIAEAQANHVLEWIQRWSDGETVTPTFEATRRFNEAMSGAMSDTVWASGCDSWYLGPDGQPELFPWPPREYRKMMAVVDEDDYRVRRRELTAERAQA